MEPTAGSTLIAIAKFLSCAHILHVVPVQLNFGSGLQSRVAVTQKYACMRDHFCVLTFVTVLFYGRLECGPAGVLEAISSVGNLKHRSLLLAGELH